MSFPDVSSFVSLGDPSAHPPHFFGLEAIFTACFAVTIRDVASRYRAGDRFALFQWLVAFVYGIAMELIAFNAFPDYVHGQFSVELYHRKLPLYVTFVYVVFHYTSLRLVTRLRLGALAEAAGCGLALVLIDAPFDIAGAAARWWTWLPSAHVAARWLGVPLTSYEWYLIFGAALAWLCRVVRPRVEKKSAGAYLLFAPCVALGTIALGVVGFLPFHALEALGLHDAILVGAHVVIAAALVARARREGQPAALPRALASIPIALALWHIAVLAELSKGRGLAAIGVAVAATLAMLFLFLVDRGPLRRVEPAALGVR